MNINPTHYDMKQTVLLLLALAGSAMTPAAAQTTAAFAQPTDPTVKPARVSDATDAGQLYENPIGLRCLGNITVSEPPFPAASYVSRNPMNEGAFYWAPKDATLKYVNRRGVSGTWSVPGAAEETFTGVDLTAVYPTVGTYDFPTLTIGSESYQAPVKLKIGGIAELCHADTREWLTTYALGERPFDSNHGWLGGTNTLGIAGVGNLYMTSLEEGYLDAVNVYLPAKPSRHAADAKIRVRVWMPSITDTGMVLTNLPLDGDYISMSDFKTSEDGVWVPVQGGAVARLELTSPIDLYGKPYIFIDVDGFGNDPTTEDFRILMDVMPNISMEMEQWSNLLAHNSFVRMNGESDYLRPVNMFGGGFGSFMICPVIRGGETPYITGVGSIDSDDAQAVTVYGRIISVRCDGNAALYSLDGRKCLESTAEDGEAVLDASSLAAGVYIVSNGRAAGKRIILK